MSHFRNIFSLGSSSSSRNRTNCPPITITCDDTPSSTTTTQNAVSCNTTTDNATSCDATNLGIVYDTHCPMCVYSSECPCPQCNSDNYEVTIDGQTGPTGTMGGRMTESIIPDVYGAYSIGNSDYRLSQLWTRELHVGDSTIYFDGGASISATGEIVHLPLGSTIGGLNPGKIFIKGRKTSSTELVGIDASAGDAYIIDDELYICYDESGPSFENVGPFIGPTGSTGHTGYTGMTGAVGTGPTGEKGAAFFTLASPNADIEFPRSNFVVKTQDTSGAFSYAYTKTLLIVVFSLSRLLLSITKEK